MLRDQWNTPFRGHYDYWTASRMKGVDKYIGLEYFKDKTLLELGAGHAHNGNKFSEWGAIVTSTDARKEHLDVANQLYPHIKTFILDADKDDIKDHYDIILHWGLLYHLGEIEHHLHNVSQKCSILLLETEVADSNDKSFVIHTTEKGFDQAFNTTGIRPSAELVEAILAKNSFHFERIQDPILNALIHRYDWEVQNTQSSPTGFRRFWICWKEGVDSPLRYTT